jgi:hypothetical protein
VSDPLGSSIRSDISHTRFNPGCCDEASASRQCENLCVVSLNAGVWDRLILSDGIPGTSVTGIDGRRERSLHCSWWEIRFTPDSVLWSCTGGRSCARPTVSKLGLESSTSVEVLIPTGSPSRQSDRSEAKRIAYSTPILLSSVAEVWDEKDLPGCADSW